MANYLLDHFDETQVGRLLDAYSEAYDGIYGDDEASMMKYLEEAFADVYAKIRRGRAETGIVQKTTDVFGDQIENARRNAQTGEATRETRGSPGERYSMKNMLGHTWDEQLKNHRHSDTLVISETTDSFLQGVSNKPLAVPIGIVTKAQSGKDASHSVSDKSIRKLQNGIRHAPIVIDNPIRNSLVYITAIQDHGGLVTAAFLKDQVFDQEEVHRATSIHSRQDIQGTLDNLGSDATVYIRKNELDKTPGSSLQLGTLKAHVEFIDDIIADSKPAVNSKFSMAEQNNSKRLSLPTLEDSTSEALAVEKLDTNYLEAVERGDLQTEQRMVDEAAEKTMPRSVARTADGKLMRLYHGTDAEFYTFDPVQFGEKNGRGEGYGIYLTDDQTLAGHYGDRLIESYANITKPAYGDRKTLSIAEVKRLVMALCERDAKTSMQDDGYDNWNDALRDTWISGYADTYSRPMSAVYGEVARQIYQANDNDSDIIYEIMNADGIVNYKAAMEFFKSVLTPAIGIDGFWYKKSNGSSVIIALDSAQIKSADPVTYDDQGNVIPLSERFRTDRSGAEEWKNRDIRYSMSEKDEPERPGLPDLEDGEQDEQTEREPLQRVSLPTVDSLRQAAPDTSLREGGKETGEPLQRVSLPTVDSLRQAAPDTSLEEGGIDQNGNGKASHTPEQLKVIDEYKAAINPNVQTAFEERYQNGDAAFQRINISPVTERQATDAANLLGGDYTGYTNAINSNGIQHTINRHGPNGVADQSMSSFEDAARVGYVLANYDTVEIARDREDGVDVSAEFRDKNNRPAPMLKYSKRIDGTYYVVQAVPDSKWKKMWVVSSYIKNTDSVTQALDVQSPLATSETSLASPLSANKSIAQSEPNYNNNLNGGNAYESKGQESAGAVTADAGTGGGQQMAAGAGEAGRSAVGQTAEDGTLSAGAGRWGTGIPELGADPSAQYRRPLSRQELSDLARERATAAEDSELVPCSELIIDGSEDGYVRVIPEERYDERLRALQDYLYKNGIRQMKAE